ncbi:energy transducer TonB [Hyphobacterium sp. HN65]|uniref:Energy transducer TonB n=1 Tax=Hyphobacterium lacteum TaxID=3116575 RepID=A0ABU7LT06_9PROT|nr:energy transducer TonB [Hyphobacterium sp. HN65]MEE2527023.1 energy transducer TonB [Hyphobacterium sp. HN65]
MQRLLRTTMSLPLAGLITISLAALMAYLISVEGESGPAITEIQYELFPRVEVIGLPPPEEIEPVDAVDPPPPPPAIEIPRSGPPNTGIDVIIGTLPPIVDPGLNTGNMRFAGTANPTPIVRIPPIYPPRLLERGIEGYCSMIFDVGTDGTPINIRASYCSNNGFERNSIRSVERWRYSPAMDNGTPIVQRGVTTQIDFAIRE